MSRVTGMGGAWIVAGAGGQAVVHNSSYDYEISGEVDDTTDTGSGSWRQGTPVINKFESATIRVFEDDAAFPEAAGLIENQVLTIWFKRGSRNLYDKVTGTIVTRYRMTSEATKVRVIEITISYGSFERGAIPP